MVNLDSELYLVLLETGHISYDEYIRTIPVHLIPPEYATVALFLKNKGKASERILNAKKAHLRALD